MSVPPAMYLAPSRGPAASASSTVRGRRMVNASIAQALPAASRTASTMLA